MRSLLRDCQAAMKIHLVRENLVKGERRIWIAPVDNFIFWLPASPLNAYVISLPIYIYIFTYLRMYMHIDVYIYVTIFLFFLRQHIEMQGNTVHRFSRRWLHVAYEKHIHSR